MLAVNSDSVADIGQNDDGAGVGAMDSDNSDSTIGIGLGLGQLGQTRIRDLSCLSRKNYSKLLLSV